MLITDTTTKNYNIILTMVVRWPESVILDSPSGREDNKVTQRCPHQVSGAREHCEN